MTSSRQPIIVEMDVTDSVLANVDTLKYCFADFIETYLLNENYSFEFGDGTTSLFHGTVVGLRDIVGGKYTATFLQFLQKWSLELTQAQLESQFESKYADTTGITDDLGTDTGRNGDNGIKPSGIRAEEEQGSRDKSQSSQQHFNEIVEIIQNHVDKSDRRD